MNRILRTNVKFLFRCEKQMAVWVKFLKFRISLQKSKWPLGCNCKISYFAVKNESPFGDTHQRMTASDDQKLKISKGKKRPIWFLNKFYSNFMQYITTFRSNQNFAMFTGEHLCQSLFLIKLQVQRTPSVAASVHYCHRDFEEI